MYCRPGLSAEESLVKLTETDLFCKLRERNVTRNGMWNSRGQFEKSTVPWVFVFLQLLQNQSSKMRLKMTIIYYHVPAVRKGLDIKSLFLVHFGCLVQFD